MQACLFHRQQVVAGGDPRPAAEQCLGSGRVAEQAEELRAQLRRCAEHAAIEVVGIGTIARAGDVAGPRVERLDVTAEAFRRTGVEQAARVLSQRGGHGIGISDCIDVKLPGILRLRDHGHVCIDRQAQRQPAREAAVEHGHASMPEQAQQPPEARGRHRTIAGVVDNDLMRGRDPQALEHSPEIRGLGHRVPAGGRRLAMVAEVAVEVHVARAGQVRCVPGALAGAGIGAGKHEARIHDPQRGIAQVRRQRRRIDQGAPLHQVTGSGHVVASSRLRRLTSIAAVAPQIRYCAHWNSTNWRRPPR